MVSVILLLGLLTQLYGGGLGMGSGANSTLKLNPTGKAAITFDCTGAAARTGGYVVDLETLRLNEEKRLEVAYSESANVDGGEAVSSHGPLVPVTFRVAVYGTTQADMITRAETLLAAVINDTGGTLEFLPEDLGAVRSTFYHYIKSTPPRPLERWDKGPHDSGLYRMQVEVELTTQPFATSDPANPVLALDTTTIYNQNDGVAGHVDIPAASIKGSIPALTRLRIKNLIAGAWATIGKLWYARRADPRVNFDPILEGGTPDTASSVWWTTVADTSRRGDSYLKYAPPEAANGQWAYRYYSITNITQHEGKAAVVAVVRSLGNLTAWDLKATLEVADAIMETEVKNVHTVGVWHVLVLGELDIPPITISDAETYDTKLYLYLRRVSGSAEIHLDFLMLLYTDEFPQEITVGEGIAENETLLLENFEGEICHVIDISLKLAKTAEALCPLLELEPGATNRLDFIWQRLKGADIILDDGFEDYEAWRWRKVADFESDETWVCAFTSADTVHYVEGAQGLKFDGMPDDTAVEAVLTYPTSQDFESEGRFTDDDYVVLAVYISAVPANWASIAIQFHTAGADYYTTSWTTPASWAAGWNFWKVKKSDFIAYGNPDWADINTLNILILTGTNGADPFEITVDDWRIVKADPDDATKVNDTGTIWDFMLERWHIYELDGADKALGCLDITAGLEQVALIHEEPPENLKYLARVRAERDNGEVGLVFRAEDGISGSEDMASFFVDTTNDQLELRKWAAGAASDIAAHVDQVAIPDTDYWLGVWIVNRSTVYCYFGTSKAAIWDENNLEFVGTPKFSITDAAFAAGGALEGGQAGLLSIGTLGRFDDVEIYEGGEGQVPSDTIQIYLPVIFRTIYPFRE